SYGRASWVSGFFRSRTSLEAEIVALRHQLNVLQRKAPRRLVFSQRGRWPVPTHPVATASSSACSVAIMLEESGLNRSPRFSVRVRPAPWSDLKTSEVSILVI